MFVLLCGEYDDFVVVVLWILGCGVILYELVLVFYVFVDVNLLCIYFIVLCNNYLCVVGGELY